MSSFLLTRPRGAYTAYTSLETDLSPHLSRLLESTSLLFPSSPIDPIAVSRFLRSHSPPRGYMAVVLIWADPSGTIHMEGTHELPAPPLKESCALVVFGRAGTRGEAPKAKDSLWVRERKSLEEFKEEWGAEEVLLVDEDGLLEGLVTNFFVVRRDGRVLTAPDEVVLNGTARRRMLEGWDRANREVVKEIPRWGDRGEWECAVITSVAKPMCFVREIRNAVTGEFVVLSVQGELVDCLRRETA